MSRLFALLLPLFVCACSSTTEGEEAEEDKEAIVRPGDVPDGSVFRTSRTTPFESMCEELAKGDVVYLGEYHPLAAHHEMQLQVIRQLHARGRLDAIGMEMFQRPFQKDLDDYIAHRTDEATMLERTEWKKRWGYEFKLYKPILDFAREHRIEIVALNVSTEIKSVVSEKGREGLDEEQLASLPEEDRSYKGYKERIAKVARMHKPGEEMDDDEIERYHRGQLLWDDVMADSIVRWMRRSPKNTQMAVVIGGGHVSGGWAVPARARKRQGGSHKRLVMLMTGMDTDERMAEDYADFVWVAKGVKLPPVRMPKPKPAETAQANEWDPPKDLGHWDSTPEEQRAEIDLLLAKLMKPDGDEAQARLALVAIGKPAYLPILAHLARLDREVLKWDDGKADGVQLGSAMLADLCLRELDGFLDEKSIGVLRPGMDRESYRKVLRIYYKRWRETIEPADEIPGPFDVSPESE